MHKLYPHLILLSFFCCLIPTSFSYASITLKPDPNNNNQIRINAALSDDSKREDGILTVYLSKGTYTITDTIYLGKDTILTGDKEAVIKLASGANWPKGKTMIENKANASNVIIRNFQLDANRFENSSSSCKEGSYDAVLLKNVITAEISDMYIYRSANDAVKIEDCESVKFHDNIVREQGGNGFSIFSSDNVQVYNNNISVSCGSGVKMEESGDVFIFGNILSSDKNGLFGIEIGEGGRKKTEIYANKIYGLQGDGIFCSYSTTFFLRIHHNIIYECTNGIKLSRFSSEDPDGTVYIDFNTIDSNSAAAVDIHIGGYVNVWVQNNIFSRNPGVFGEFISQGNCFANNPGASSLDYSASDAVFVDLSVRDYHLKSKAGRWSGTSWVADKESSPCLDKGVEFLRAEPYPNGCNPNPGRYGNTTEASLSGEIPPVIMPGCPDRNSYGYFGSDEIIYNEEREEQCFVLSSSEEIEGEENKTECLFGNWCVFAATASNFLQGLIKIMVLLILLLMLAARLLYVSSANQSALIYRIRFTVRYAFLTLILFLILFILMNIIIYLRR